MSEPVPRGLVDTSVVIAGSRVTRPQLPRQILISTVTLAELAAGPHTAATSDERARRQETLQRAERLFDALPVGVETARAYGRVYAAALAAGRKPRGRRALDLLIAATALAHSLPLYTLNPQDVAGLESLVDVVPVVV